LPAGARRAARRPAYTGRGPPLRGSTSLPSSQRSDDRAQRRAVTAGVPFGSSSDSRLRRAHPAAVIQLVGSTYDWPGAEIDPRHPLATTLLAAMSEVLGRPVSPSGFLGATEAHLLARRGIPTIPAAGPGVITRAHALNEWVEINPIVAATEIYALTALDFLAWSGGRLRRSVPGTAARWRGDSRDRFDAASRKRVRRRGGLLGPRDRVDR
jgi:hypothetical protein